MPADLETPRIHRDVRSYLLDGDVILFDRRKTQLFALNSTASLIWLELEAGHAATEIAKGLKAETGTTMKQAAHDVAQVLKQWRKAGVVQSGDASEVDVPSPNTVETSPSDGRIEIRVRPDTTAVKRVFRLMNAGFRVIVDSEAAAVVDDLFGHLAAPEEAARDDWATLEVSRHNGRWALSVDGALLGACDRTSEIGPVIYRIGSILAYRASACFAAIHAAAVARDSRCALLPGPSGTGKSTLTAALVANGYRYCADDVAVLAGDPLRLFPAPLKIGLKHDAWQALEKLWPDLTGLSIHYRADGKLLKYLLPGTDQLPGAAERSLAVTALVFPTYAPGKKTRLRPIARSEALIRVAQAGYDLPGSLNEDSVRTLVEWFETLSCYDLRFAKFKQAVGRFAEVFE